jgi:DNA-binding IclR family transcriptional regulator
VHPGRVAAERYPVLAAARPEMAALSAEFDLACFAFTAEEDHARLVHYTWPSTQSVPAVRLGETVPMTPPLGMVFVAWADDAVFADWLALAPDLDPEQRAHHGEQRRAIRELGFVVELAPPASRQAALAQVMDDRASPWRDGELHRLLAGAAAGAFVVTDLIDARPLAVTGIAAPVFDPTGQVVLSLNLVTFPEPLTTTEVAVIGPAVRSAADRVTATLCTLQRVVVPGRSARP